MHRPPPRATRTDTLFPYTTLVRSKVGGGRRRVAALTLRLAPGLVRGAGHFGPGDAHALLAQILDQLALRGVDDRRGRLMLGVEPHRHALVAARHRDVEPAEGERHQTKAEEIGRAEV